MNKTVNSKKNSTEIDELNTQEINVNIRELILTPLTCASVVNEIIKCLVYQKSQIPYPYNWLKSVVNRKRTDSKPQAMPVNFAVERHYGVVSTAYNVLEDLMWNISREFKTYADDIQQVLILLGSTIYSAKEAYRIRVMGLANGHSEDNHLYTNTRNQHKVLRNIVLAEEWMRAMESMIPPTNMYILLQKRSRNIFSKEDGFFKSNIQYVLPSRIKSILINLNYQEDGLLNCCDNLSIFEDLPKEELEIAKGDVINVAEAVQSDDLADSSCNCDRNCDLQWFQANVTLKGFKECFINDVSATELW